MWLWRQQLYLDHPSSALLWRLRRRLLLLTQILLLPDMTAEHGRFHAPFYISISCSSAKGLHKGTSEAPVLSESERERRSKDISLWGEGKRKRFPLQPFAEE